MRKLLSIVFVLSIMLIGACVERTATLGDSNMNWIGRGPWAPPVCPYCGDVL